MPFEISVVIPSYNYDKYISKAIDSVLNQQNVQVDLIVVDDGSTDQTLSILAGYEDKIRLFKQVNSGASAAKNLGIDKARYDYITFLDADDWLLENSLAERCAYLINHPEYDWIYAKWLVADSEGKIQGDAVDFFGHKEGVLKGDIFSSLIRGYAGLNTLTPLFKTVDVRAIGGFCVQYKAAEDYDFLLRISRGKQVGFYSGIACGVQRLHESHLSSKPALRYMAELRILEKYKKDKEVLGYMNQRYGDRVSNLYNYLASAYSEEGKLGLLIKACLQSFFNKPVQRLVYRILFYGLIGRPNRIRSEMRNGVMEMFLEIKEGKGLRKLKTRDVDHK